MSPRLRLQVQAALGGNLRGIISGAAPLSATVMDWLRCSMGCVVVEGYENAHKEARVQRVGRLPYYSEGSRMISYRQPLAQPAF
jgi:hypothetical protein